MNNSGRKDGQQEAKQAIQSLKGLSGGGEDLRDRGRGSGFKSLLCHFLTV